MNNIQQRPVALAGFVVLEGLTNNEQITQPRGIASTELVTAHGPSLGIELF